MAREAFLLTEAERQMLAELNNLTLDTGDILIGDDGSIIELDNDGTIGQVLTSNGAGFLPTWEGAGGGGGQVDTVAGGTGIDVNSADPINPVVALNAASIASLALADSALQSGDNISELNNNLGFTTNTGTVTSVDLSVPTGLAVTGNPVTTSGTIAMSLSAGYVIPTQSALDDKVDENAAITGATKTKITYDAKGLVTAGDDATTADITDSVDRRYMTDAERTVVQNTSGTNTGNQTITLTGDVTGTGTGSFTSTVVKRAEMLSVEYATTIESPTDSEDIAMFRADKAITVNKVSAVLKGSSSPSVTWTIRYASDRSAAGTEIVTGGTTTTSTTTGSVVTSLNNTAISAGDWVWIETTAQSGTVDEIVIVINGLL